MARICKEIQERIETTRTEAQNQCRNVSHTVSETICSWMPWPLDDLCDLVTRVITEVVCAIVYVVITVISWVTRIVCEIIVIIDWIITFLVNAIEWLGNRIITFPEWLLCLAGVKGLRKNYRICPMVIANDEGNPLVPLNVIQNQINTAIRIYNNCNVNVIASPIIVVTGKSFLATGPSCDAEGFFSEHKLEYEHLSCCNGLLESIKCLRFPSGIIWPRHILKTIWVADVPGKVGCYLFPNSFLLVDADAAIDTLAHEMGHACDLFHVDEQANLMHPGDRTSSTLTNFQCCTIRTAKFVTVF
jgi:hypothetical protein